MPGTLFIGGWFFTGAAIAPETGCINACKNKSKNTMTERKMNVEIE
jgi:hypothetical protein